MTLQVTVLMLPGPLSHETQTVEGVNLLCRRIPNNLYELHGL